MADHGTPWTAGNGVIIDVNGAGVSQDMTIEDAEYTVTCVNAHEELVAALKWADRQLNALVTEDDGSGTFIRGTGTELGGFCIGRDAMRSILSKVSK